MAKLGVILTNIGTPSTPDTPGVKRYLREFLSDPQVIRLPRLIWLPLLHAVILPLRSPKSAKLYQAIWTEQGSPLQAIMTSLAANVAAVLSQELKLEVMATCGMHYGQPSIPDAVTYLQAHGIQRIVFLPMFPQYSTASTVSTIHMVHALSLAHPNLDCSYIKHYADHPAYIAALGAHIIKYYNPSTYLLSSFHGIPASFVAGGDPYADLCRQTADLLATELKLAPEHWGISFQSRFGWAPWIKPYTVDVLTELPRRGVVDVSLVCPGFAVDCLETLEEIAIQAKETFMEAGGKSFVYIPALNAEHVHAQALAAIIKTHLMHPAIS